MESEIVCVRVRAKMATVEGNERKKWRRSVKREYWESNGIGCDKTRERENRRRKKKKCWNGIGMCVLQAGKATETKKCVRGVRVQANCVPIVPVKRKQSTAARRWKYSIDAQGIELGRGFGLG